MLDTTADAPLIAATGTTGMIDRRANAVRAAVADSAIRRAVDMLLDYDDDGYRHDHQAA